MKQKSISDMFFDFTFAKCENDFFEISKKSQINSQGAGFADKYIAEVVLELPEEGKVMAINLKKGFPDSIKAEAGSAFCEDDEAYALEILTNEINLYADTNRGFIYAVSTLKQLISGRFVSRLVIFDRPDKKIRGYRVYIPGADSIDAFKKMIDKLIYYKYNSVIIEVGGAMEYEKHPEINKKWVEFCTEVHKGPEESKRIQEQTFWWAKNSIHADNGDGGYVTKAQMRDIVEYCREREIEVIPEVPSLSHSDYIVMAHPDINERVEDTYPDTYCPSNPKSYEILFDIIDEVSEVFKPKYMNIGHDEVYTLALCDRCKGKNPVDLYVGDIIKINEYLKTKNITAIMWCEKMFEKEFEGRPAGGAADPEKGIPELVGCVGRIPKDIMLLQWYWRLCDYEDEKKILDLGYKMLYGNFNALLNKEYRKRIGAIEGGFVSNWGSIREEYMQRNLQNFSIAATAHIFWSHTYDNCDEAYVLEKTAKELSSRYADGLGNEIIKVKHTTNLDKEQPLFYDGVYIVPEDWILGYYVIRYTDGTTQKLPVNYGYNIGCSGWEIHGENVKKLYGAAKPIEENGKIYYEASYKNPYPQKQVECINYEAVTDAIVDYIEIN